jgi:hypothetical protein
MSARWEKLVPISTIVSAAKGTTSASSGRIRIVCLMVGSDPAKFVAQAAAADFAWPAPFTMEMQSCGRAGAAWADKTRTVRVCYELAFDFVQLYRAYVGAAPTPASASPKRRQKSK